MGMLDGFPFTSKKERERRRKSFEKRVVPFGADAQREKLNKTLRELFPDIDDKSAMFAFFDAKDAYTKAEAEKAEADGDDDDMQDGNTAAHIRLRKQRWMDARKVKVMLRLIELESKITSLEDYPTAEDVYAGLSEK